MSTRSVIAVHAIHGDSGLIEPGSPWDCPEDEYASMKANGAVVDAEEGEEDATSDEISGTDAVSADSGSTDSGSEGDSAGDESSPI